MFTSTPSRIFTIRIPEALERDLSIVAERDHTSLSAAARRLMVLGLRTEEDRAVERRSVETGS